MRIPHRTTSVRRGISLLEVLVALTIFFLSISALSQLISYGSDKAIEVEVRSLAARLCQSKLAEVVAGVELLESQSEVPFDEYPDASWSVEVEEASVSGLWTVSVTVVASRGGQNATVVLRQMVLDPSLKGSTMDQTVITGEDDTTPDTEEEEEGITTGN